MANDRMDRNPVISYRTIGIAAGDLQQYRAVDYNNEIPNTANGEPIQGICEINFSTGEVASVVVEGEVYVILSSGSAGVTKGDRLTVDSTTDLGALIEVGAPAEVTCAKALEDGVAGDIILVEVYPNGVRS